MRKKVISLVLCFALVIFSGSLGGIIKAFPKENAYALLAQDPNRPTDSRQPIIPVKPEGDPSLVRDDKSAFVGGVNQSYLNYRRISEKDLMNEIKKGLNHRGDTDLPSDASIKSETAGFLNFSDIIQNPGNYFQITPFISSNPSLGSYLQVGLNYQKLNDTLQYINYPIKETTYNRFYIRNVKLKGVDTSYIRLSADIQVKMYTDKPWPLDGIWCIVNVTGNCDINIKYSVNSADNSIIFHRINASDITIERSILSYLSPLAAVNIVVDYIISKINVNQSIDEKVTLKFLPVNYVRFRNMYTQDFFLYMNFDLIIPDKVYEVLDMARSLNIPILNALNPTDAVPVMTGNTTPSGVASASSIYGSDFEAWRAFDGDDQSGSWSRWISKPGSFPAWLSYQFPSEKRIAWYYILPEYGATTKDRSPKNWSLQGWNGSSWVNVDTRSNIALDNVWNSSGLYFQVQQPGYYKQYRLYVTALNGSDAVSIRQLKLFQ